MSDPIEFTLEDAQGTPHTYECTPHSATEGLRLSREIVGAAGQPIARLASENIGPLVDLFQGGEISLDSDPQVLIDKLEDLDLDLGQAVKDITQAVADAGDATFFKRLFASTYRDGLHLRQTFDTAYQANYTELYRAAWQVIKINGFLGRWGIS